jgi:hypothetical protein
MQRTLLIAAVKGGNEGEVSNMGLAFVPAMLEKLSCLVQEADAALGEKAARREQAGGVGAGMGAGMGAGAGV